MKNIFLGILLFASFNAYCDDPAGGDKKDGELSDTAMKFAQRLYKTEEPGPGPGGKYGKGIGTEMVLSASIFAPGDSSAAEKLMAEHQKAVIAEEKRLKKKDEDDKKKEDEEKKKKEEEEKKKAAAAGPPPAPPGDKKPEDAKPEEQHDAPPE